MALMRCVFNYNKALEWTTKYSETPLYTPEYLPADKAQAYINRDIPRAFFFSKNKFSNDTSHYFYSGWTHIDEPFCYMQGDMDGGSFIQLVWQTFAIASDDLNLIHGDHYNDLRFGYVGDDKKRRSIALIYSKDDPSKWMFCMTEDSEKASFDQRGVTIFIPSYFCEKVDFTEDAEQFFQIDASELIGTELGSELLEQKFKTFFGQLGGIDIERIEAFEKNDIKKMGAQYIADDEEELPDVWIVPPSPRDHVLDKLGAITFAAAGWYVGVFVVGPLLAVPTLGFSLIIAPPICVLIGAVLGLMIGGIFSNCFGRVKECVRDDTNGDGLNIEKKPGGGSHTYIAKRGLQVDLDYSINSVPSKSAVKQSEVAKVSPPVIEAQADKSRPRFVSRL